MGKGQGEKQDNKKPHLKMGGLTDDEKRQIEQLVKFDTFASIGKKLNRQPQTIRKWCQRNNITKDSTSVSKNIEEKKKRSPHFEELANILTERELELAIKIYTELMKQFGGDILPSEEIQVIDFCVISAMLNRALAREKEILRLMEQQTSFRDELEKQRAAIDDEEEQQNWYDKVDQVDLRIASLSDELKEVKKNQIAFMQKKENANKGMYASRDQRAQELAKMNENWADYVLYLKANPNFRLKLGYEMEKYRLAVNEEFIRLSEIHRYADGEMDYPVFNSEVVEREAKLEASDDMDEEEEQEQKQGPQETEENIDEN